MKKKHSVLVYKSVIVCMIFLLCSCDVLEKYDQEPELESLQQCLKTSAAIGYCVSVANSAFKGEQLPSNVVLGRNEGLIYINIDANHPLPFNNNIGDIVIACIYKNGRGVMCISFADIDLLGGSIKLCGIQTVPFMEKQGEGIWALYARQDIVIGNSSDTLLNLSTVTPPVFDAEIDRLNQEKPTDIFAAVKQNVWFMNINQANTHNDVYDDDITISGGGQIAEIKGKSGGVIYHAVINAKINYSICPLNPISGYALSQNFEAGGEPYVDLGNSLLSFHNNCDGMVHVDFSSGKYSSYNGKNVSLNIR